MTETEHRTFQTVEIVAPDEWDSLVARLGGDDVYERYGYHAASAHLEVPGTQPVLLHFTDLGEGGEVALPLLLRPLPDGAAGFDATSAYGYGGPVALGEIDRAAFGAALDAWAAERGVVATFLRFHPLLANARLAPAGAELIELGSTVGWRVTPERGELLPLMHSHHRRAARKADRAELELRVTVAPESLDAFRTMYDETMRRQEATAFYFFDDAYWQALIDDCGGDVVLIEGLLEGEPVAALLCMAHGANLHYHLGASTDVARSIGASNRCFLAAAEWAQANELTTFHLGGGVGGGSDSPLFTFKHRYDPESEPLAFHIGKLVHDTARYRELAGTDSTDGYFPPWRAPA
ncbi:MAG: GNAT family N-acetyltransferase [Gaiellales bacterium]